LISEINYENDKKHGVSRRKKHWRGCKAY